MLTPSEANKIKKGILAASEVAKCRICRKVIETLRIYRLHYYTDEQVNHFLDLCQKTDFEAATTYYVNTMLAGFKKKEPILYQSDLVSHSADLVMVHDINPNSKDVIDKALSTSNYAGILKALHAYMKKASFIRAIDNVLYLLWEICRRPQEEIPAGVKHCAFHLLAQYQASRKDGKMTKLYAQDTLIYLQDKYHCFDESDPKEMSVYQGTVRQNDFKTDWQQFFNPSGSTTKKRTTLKDLEEMLNGMDRSHAELVHYLFMCNYIDYNRYHFRDEWMIDRYVEIYNAYFQESPIYLHEVNAYVIEIMKEWQKDANHKYQKAKKDLVWWMTDPIPAFKPSLGDEVEAAWQKVCYSDEEAVVAEALLPYPYKILELIKTGQYEDAAANVYCILEHLVLADKAHEDWFDCMWDGGVQTDVVNLVEVLQELYAHLRQLKDLPTNLKNEMDIHLEIFNKKTCFFGIDCGDSRYDDMLLDGKKQYGNYSDLSDCYMWSEWYLPKIKGKI